MLRTKTWSRQPARQSNLLYRLARSECSTIFAPLQILHTRRFLMATTAGTPTAGLAKQTVLVHDSAHTALRSCCAVNLQQDVHPAISEKPDRSIRQFLRAPELPCTSWTNNSASRGGSKTTRTKTETKREMATIPTKDEDLASLIHGSELFVELRLGLGTDT